MALCPSCQNELPDDFGLIECGNCKAPLIIQMDGAVQSVESTPQPTDTEDIEPNTQMNPNYSFGAEQAAQFADAPIPQTQSAETLEAVDLTSPMYENNQEEEAPMAATAEEVVTAAKLSS